MPSPKTATASKSSPVKAAAKASPAPRQGLLARGAVPGETSDLAQSRNGEEAGDNQFVEAVGRAFAVLSAFRVDDGPLGNTELADRTGLPKPTVSRLTYTLARLGYMSFNPRYRVYELGPGVVALGHVAMKTIDVRQFARPLMLQLAHQSNFNVGLAARDRHVMTYLDAFEGDAVVGLRLYPGFRLPMLTTSVGRAYLVGLEESERELVISELRPHFEGDWTKAMKIVKNAVADFSANGFCSSVGEWRGDVHGVSAPIRSPAGGQVYAVNLGAPAYLLPRAKLLSDLGPKVAELARKVEAAMLPLPGLPGLPAPVADPAR
jgi:DNA-binding IclR family transcriptional regulator